MRCKNQVQGDEIKDSIFKQEVAYCKVCKKPTPPPKARKRSKAKFDFDDDDDDSEEEDDDNRALMKPDIVFFGEKLPQIFDRSLAEDRELVDLLIVIGSSLKVAPVSDIMRKLDPFSFIALTLVDVILCNTVTHRPFFLCNNHSFVDQLPNTVPQILINRTPNHQMDFDVQLLGNCDTIVAELCRMVGWELKHDKLPGGTSNVPDMDKNTNMDGSGTGGRAAWTFKEPNLYLFEGADLEELDFEAIKEKNRKRLMEMSGVYKGALGGLGDDDEGDDDEDEDEEDEEDDDDGDDDDDETGPVSEDMEGLLMVSSERRPQSREGRATSVGMMDEDDEDSDNASGESEDTIRAAVVHPFGANPTTTSTAAALGAGAVPTLTEGFLSPRLQPSVGFASGTTEPRSGSITEIHHDVLSAAAAAAAASAPVLPTSAVEPGVSTERVRTLFTEHMPKDLGEDEAVFDTNSTSSHSHGNVFLSHSRRPSEDLVSITEDPQLEVDDDEEVEVEVDIEVGGPELARGAGGGGH